MDILYTLGRGSIWQNNELRYSLRSIDKYGKNVRRIYIVGDFLPSFVNQAEVTFIKCEQPYKDKFHNILYSILYACEHSDIAEDFLLSSDDHFYLRAVDFDDYPYWLKSEELPNADCQTGYKRHLWETRRLLELHGYEYKNYAQHCNTHFVKSVLLAHKDIIEESFKVEKGVEATCLMLNILQKERPFQYIERKDIKLKTERGSQITSAIRERDCFSISDRVIDLVKPILESKFCQPCRYENRASCCVVVPIYKEKLSEGEQMSVDRTTEVFAKRPIFFFAPESLDTSYYEERYKTATITRFDDSYFKSVDDYTRLLCTPDFYEAYSEYEYMLIDQPDCWTFRDEIDQFCEMGYDYIGAPWPVKKGVPKWKGVGNGGFCLRRISKFIDICKRRENTEYLPEDWFFCVKCADDLNIAPLDVASHFSLEICPETFFFKFGRVVPMGCHKPYAYHYEKFWKKLHVPFIRP